MESAKHRRGSGPLVSVIIPVYNVADYLAESVESVLGQSYPNWELLLVDDGSLDESPRIAAEFQSRDPDRILCLAHDGSANKGASASRNLGLARARGGYIAFLDADDRWLPDKLAHQVGLAQRYPSADMICGASLYWRSWRDGGADEVFRIGCPQNTLFEPRELMTLLYPLGRGNAPSMNGLLVKRRVIERIGGFEEAFPGMYDDQVFLSKIYLSCHVYICDKVYDWYRQNRPGSLCYTSRVDRDYYRHRLQYLQWLKAYMTAGRLRDVGIERARKREVVKCRFPRCYRVGRRVWRKGRSAAGGLRCAMRSIWNTERVR